MFQRKGSSCSRRLPNQKKAKLSEETTASVNVVEYVPPSPHVEPKTKEVPMMIEALSMAEDQSMEPQSPALTIQNLLGNLEPESAHIYVAQKGRRW